MHQTLYIDIDEEITSVVERLKKSKAEEVIIVVPKRALLIQSIVNLRLLKKQADSLGLQLMIVTQDKLGKLLVEKAGILVQQKLDDSLEEETRISEESHLGNVNLPMSQESSVPIMGEKNKFDDIGSDNYFDSKGVSSSAEIKAVKKESFGNEKEAEKITNKELVVDIGKEIKKKTSFMDSSVPSHILSEANNYAKSGTANPVGSIPYGANRPEGKMEEVRRDRPLSGNAWQEEKVRNFFTGNHHSANYQNNNDLQREKSFPKEKSFSFDGGKRVAKKITLGIVMVVFLGAVAVGGYFFIPQATVALTMKEKIKEQDCNVKGNTNTSKNDYEGEIIPIKLVTMSDDISQTFTTSGKSSSSNQKARGKISIYNEFSTSSQPLVATTRFLSESGKLFRLVQGVTVPGASKDGDSLKAGVIEAEVVADEAGESFNIGPAKFSIPGFENNKEKYAKIYAKSSSNMSGGGSGQNNDANTSGTITDSDISRAKTQIQSAIAKSVKDKIKGAIENGFIISDDAINIEEPTYKFSNSVGEAASNFQVSAHVQASALAFKEEDLKNMVGNIIVKANGGDAGPVSNTVSLEYGKITPDFAAGAIDIKVHGISKTILQIDQDKFKKEIMGKNKEELEAYLSSYPDISKAEVTYWPPFVSSTIPRYAKRISITLDTE